MEAGCGKRDASGGTGEASSPPAFGRLLSTVWRGGFGQRLSHWDFYSVPVPALFAAPNPLIVFRDSQVGASDAQAVFAYFKLGAKTGKPVYDQDLNGNGVADGIEYDRSVAGPGMSGAPDGVVGATDAQLAFAQFKRAYKC